MRRSPNRIAGLATGAVAVLFGVVAVVAGAIEGRMAGPEGVLVGPFTVTVALGILSLVVGAVLVIAAVHSLGLSKRVNVGVGTACLLLGFAGLFTVGTPANLLGASGGVNAGLFAAATVLLAVGLGARRDVQRPEG